LFLDFGSDESYTPTRIVFLAGSGGNDLVEWGEMRLEQPRGWIWADFSGVGDTDDDDDDDSEDEDDLASNDAEDDITTAHPSHRTFPTHISDIENTAGTASATTTVPEPDPEPMALDPQTTPAQAHHHQTQDTNSSPTFHRSNPRRPLHALLTPNAEPASPPRRHKHRMPVLRAHLVQIKILENHQNGKDTHLRGLQIFALDNEPARPAGADVRTPAGKSRVSVGGEAVGTARRGSGGGGGGGLGRFGGFGGGHWDVEPSIR
jgi:anaphase-promoting complex subunit 10